MSNSITSSTFTSTLANAQGQASQGKLNQLASSVGRNTVTQDKRTLDAVAKEFTSVFITQLLNIMYQDVPVDENFGGGHAEETWRGLMLDEYGKNIANAGGMGLSDMVKNQLIQYQSKGAK